VADKTTSLIISGTGDVIEPEDGILAIGSGGPYALASARALLSHSTLDARTLVEESLRIAGGIDIYTNLEITLEELTAAK
jgi:ATP-dependent HslUV protease subunit HslV